MGSVWRAEHLGWSAPVAIKLMNLDNSEQPEARARFEREVRLAAGLRSPHVVQVLDHGIDQATNTPFIAMELLEGESLASRLKRLARLSPAETFHIVNHLVRALSRAHDAGIVHRDLKPDNVFLVRNDEEIVAKVLDFGVAKGSGPQLSDGLTRPGRVLGTPYYMSPEQLKGSREIDQRADLWSLSTIVCECLTGRRPFQAADFAELALLLLGNTGRPLPSSLGPVPPGFDAWFLRATHPNLDERFQTARELGRSLAPLCGASDSFGVDAIGPTEELSGERERISRIPGLHTTSGSSPWVRHGGSFLRFMGPTLISLLVVGGGLGYWYTQQPKLLETKLLESKARLEPASPGVPPAPAASSSTAAGSDERTSPRVHPLLDQNPGALVEASAPAEAASAERSEEEVSAAAARPRKANSPPANEAAKGPRDSARTTRRESAARILGTRKPKKLAPTPESAPAPEPETTAVDVNGRRIRMTLSPSE
jgi:serine/threonine protein kinase